MQKFGLSLLTLIQCLSDENCNKKTIYCLYINWYYIF